MNKNILIVLGGGFLAAVLVAFIVQASMGGKKSDGVEILVAARALKAGDVVNDANFKWKSFSKESVFTGTIQKDGKKKIEEIADGKISRGMSSGEPLVKSILVVNGKGNSLAATMKAGMRAMAIKVSAQSMVGGFISPGDKVDVILTYQVKLSSDEKDEAAMKIDKHASETVLENVNVLAIDQSSKKEEDKAKVGRTVTLEVDVAGAEKLALASEMGDLSLVLRALGDDVVAEKGKQKVTTDVQVSKMLQELGAMKKTSGGKSNSVRVYTGQTVENISVRR